MKNTAAFLVLALLGPIPVRILVTRWNGSTGISPLAQGAGCEPDWAPTFGPPPATEAGYSLADFDDGSGPALYVGVDSGVMRWSGSSWSLLPSTGMSGGHTLTVFDDGSGPSLFAGGNSGVVEWNGSSWTELGNLISGPVRALAAFDDGSGPALHAGGEFGSSGGVVNIARWNGSSWQSLGSGVNGGVYAMTTFDDGGGPALYVGGEFGNAGGNPASNVARWDGSNWSPLGSGTQTLVLALVVFDDGAGDGPALHAGGTFQVAGGGLASRIAKWDGSSWSPLGSGLNDTVHALTVFDDGAGAGSALFVGGQFTTAGGQAANSVAKWTGSSWASLGGGMGGNSGFGVLVRAMKAFDAGTGAGPELFACGQFTTADDEAVNNVASWNGSTWAHLEGGIDQGVDGVVSAVAVFDDASGSGPELYAAGNFPTAGLVVANHIAKWDGSSWAPLGAGLPGGEVFALAVHDDGGGGGPALHAGGSFGPTHIAKWDGSSWTTIPGTTDTISALTAFDDGTGPALYAGGAFLSIGGVFANRIAKWNGTSWAPLGSGMNNTVSALGVYDDGSGAALYAGGTFTTAGGVAANRIARWNGSSWEPLGSGVSGSSGAGVFAFATFDDHGGGGPALYVGGFFTSAGGLSAKHVARWNGSSWTAVGSGISSRVFALTVFNDGSGSGPALHAGGLSPNLSRWDGSSWQTVDGALNARVLAMTILEGESGAGSALYVGGWFSNSAAGDPALARLQGCPDTTPPVLSCPPFVSVSDGLTAAPGETVTFSVTAVDDSDPAPNVICVPPSGSLFPRGTTLVTCTATDAAGNQASCEFPVTVRQHRMRVR